MHNKFIFFSKKKTPQVVEKIYPIVNIQKK